MAHKINYLRNPQVLVNMSKLAVSNFECKSDFYLQIGVKLQDDIVTEKST